MMISNERKSIAKLKSNSWLKVELNSQVDKWNQTQIEYPKNKCIHQLFEAQVEATPDAIALVIEKQQLTYRQLNQKANQLAHHLHQLGVKPEVKVAICVERSLEMIVGLFGILKAGGTYLPLDPTYPQERLSYMLEDAQVSVLLTQSKWQSQIPTYSGKIINLDTDWDSIAENDSQNPDSEVKPDNLMYIIYTSGSTGKPKGVMITHQNVCNLLEWRQQTFNLTSEDKSLQTISFSFDPSVWQIFWPLCFGAQLVLAKPGGHQDSKYIVETIINENITVVCAVPSLLRVLLEEPKISECTGLKHVTCGGEALSKDLIDKFYQCLNKDNLLYNFYGPTETTIDATYWECQRDSNYSIAPIGRPVCNAQAYILDEELQQVPLGEPGELHIGGDGVGRGYLNRPELTQQKFIPNPFSSQPNSRLYKTGDLARYLPDGNIEFMGRIDHQVKIRGFRIELGEIEAKLSQYPELEQVVVIAREDEPGQKRLVAYFVSDSDREVTPLELREFLKVQLADYMIPAAFVQMEKLPLSPNGKVDRRALPVPAQCCFPVTQEYVAPRNEIEKQISEIWSQVLGLEEVGIYDNFFELGGHSLLATQAISRLRNLLKVELSISSFFESPTIETLAKRVESNLEQKQIIELPPIETLPRDRSFPLSFYQQDPWFISTLFPERPVYNENCTINLGGAIDVAILEKSFAQMILRHEILRTTFTLQDGKPIQTVNPVYPFKIKTIDLRNIPESEREAEALKLATADLIRPFDLSQCPLMRATLIQLGDEDYRLFLAMHHLLLDGVSMVNVFLPELETAYKALSEGKPLQLPELKVQYADFAAWQKQYLTKTLFSEQLNYWQEKLADLPTLQLPSDRNPLPTGTLQGKRQCIFLSKELTENLKSLSRKVGVTLFMTLTAAFNTLLYRYSGQEDIVIGSVTDGHTQPELEGLMGNFLNPMVLRTDVSGNPTFMELLQRVRQVTVEAYANQIPVDLLLETIKTERKTNSMYSLCQVVFLIEPPISDDDSHTWAKTMSQLDIHRGMTLIDLYVELDERPEGIIGRVEYNTDLFDDATIAQLISNFQTLLEGIVTNPQQDIAQLPLLTKTEKHKLLVEYNNTQTNYPKNLTHQLFEEQVEKTPNAVAVEFENQKLTYKELNHRANQLAHYLQKQGVKPEVLVGICVERSLEMVVGLLGIMKAGGAYLPIDSAYPTERIGYMLEDAGVSVLLTQENLVKGLPSNKACLVCIDSDWELISQQQSYNPNPKLTPQNLVYVIYTSGSTGKPKGIEIVHQGLVNFLKSMSEQPGLDDSDVLLAVTTICFDIAGLEIYLPLIVGAKVVLASQEVAADGFQLLTELNKSGITVMQATPVTWQLLLAAGWQGNDRLKIICGGEALSTQLSAQLVSKSKSLWNVYGPTETTIWSTAYHVKMAPTTDATELIGCPISNTQIYILDTHLQPVPVGVPGELYIGGEGVARGYLNRPELTKEKFISHPFSDRSDARLYKTGDLARYRCDGNIEFLSRIDNQVKIRGFRIEIGEIEAALAQHSEVKQTVVIVREDQPGNKQLVAYIVTDGESFSQNKLRSFLTTRLPKYMVPSAFVQLDELPLTLNRKVDRRALPAPAETEQSKDTFVPPSNYLEVQLTNIWEEVLGIKPIGIKDDFFNLGGHSLLAVSLFNQIDKVLAVNVPLATLFQSPTIEQLASVISEKRFTEQRRSLVPIQPLGSKKPLFCIHALGGGVLYYRHLASHLSLDRPFYALQPRGQDGGQILTKVEDMAAHYISEIKTIQPQGPYFLGGSSFGGTIAWEMAQQLVAQGETVALLALFDSTSSSSFERIPARERLFNHLSSLLQLGPGYILKKMRGKFYSFKRKIKRQNEKIALESFLSQVYPNQIVERVNKETTKEYLRLAQRINKKASTEYTPQVYPGKVTLFKATHQGKPQGWGVDPHKGWKKLTNGEFTAYEVPGNHSSMLREPHVQVLAEKLQACLDIAQKDC